MSQEQESKEETQNHLSIDINEDSFDDDQLAALEAENELIEQQLQQHEAEKIAASRRSHIKQLLAQNQRLKQQQENIANPSTPPTRQPPSTSVHFASSSAIERTNQVKSSFDQKIAT